MNREKAKILLIVVASILFSWYLWQDDLDAKWGIIDDHEIAYFLGPGGNVQLSKIPSLLMGTEVGDLGNSTRYRPSYYILRIGESFVWGNHPEFWYLSRLAMFALTAGVLLWMTTYTIGIIPAALFSLCVFSDTYWADIWTRLGPGETYAVVGVALYALGFMGASRGSNTDREPGPRRSDCLLMLVGGFMAIGSKENFVLLLLPALYLFVHLKQRQRLNLRATITTALLCGYCMFIAVAVGIALVHEKVDVYGRSVTPASRLPLVVAPLVQFFFHRYVVPCLVLAAAVAGVVLLVRRRDAAVVARLREIAYRYLALFAALLGLYVSQYVFYAGKWPCNNRYDFPGVLALPLLYLGTIICIRRMVVTAGMPQAVGRAFLVVFCFGFFTLIQWPNFISLKAASTANAGNTRLFTDNIASLAKDLKKDPTVGLVLESFRASDYEPIASIGEFLTMYGVKNPMFVEVEPDPEYATSSLDADLKKSIVKASKYGATGTYLSKSGNFRSIDDLSNVVKCEAVSLDQEKSPHADCKYLGRIY